MEIGKFCGEFRVNDMGMMLKEISPNNFKALSAFEHGRSTNISHVLNYFNNCQTTELEEKFLAGLSATIRGLKNVK